MTTVPEIRIAVIGAGTMGHAIAQLFAVAGFSVRLTDSNAATLQSALPRIERNLRTLVEYGLLTEAAARAGRARIHLASTLDESVAQADVVVEAVLEDLALKREVLQHSESLVRPDTIIHSNTSSFRVGDMASALERPERFLVTHYWNPPHIIPLVEVVRGKFTSDDVVARTQALLQQAGKVPALVEKDVPGFVGNRMQHALRREALAIVAAGIASPEVVDMVARLSFGLRLPIIGPLETVDLSGLDLTQRIHSHLLASLDRSTSPSPIIQEKVERGELGAKSGRGFYEWSEERLAARLQERDKALLELVRWLRPPGRDPDAPMIPPHSTPG